MNDRIIGVTPPDDVLQDSFRLLLVDLNEDHMGLISQALNLIKNFPEIIFYIWKHGDDIDWLIDKKHKSDLIIFNAESFDQTITGYLAAQSNSYYFGILKNLSRANNRTIYDVTQVIEILEKKLG